MTDQLLDAWQIANRANLLLIDNLDEPALNTTLSSRGGRTVFEQLAHAHNLRLQWLETIAPQLHATLSPVPKGAPAGRDLLREAFVASAGAIETLIRNSMAEGGKLKGYKKGIVPFITYLVAHEAHHRGHALLTLKQSGVKLNDQLKWGLWEWK